MDKKRIKRRAFIIFSSLFVLTLFVALVSTGIINLNFLKASVTADTVYKDWSELTSVDSAYSNSTLIYTSKTKFYARTSGSGIESTYETTALVGSPATPRFKMNSTSQTVYIVITNCWIDTDGSYGDAVISVTPTEIWATGGYIYFGLKPYYKNGGTQASPKFDSTNTSTATRINYNQPLEFFLGAHLGKALTTLTYYKNLSVSETSVSIINRYSSSDTSGKSVPIVSSYSGTTATGITKVNSFYSDIDIAYISYASKTFSSKEGVMPNSGSTTAYYATNGKTIKDENNTNLTFKLAKSNDGLYIGTNSVYTVSNQPTYWMNHGITGVWYPTSTAFYTSGLSGSYQFYYSGSDCNIGFLFYSPKPYSSSYSPIKSVPSSKYSGQTFTYTIKQYIPNNILNSVYNFGSVYNNLSGDGALTQFIVEDCLPSGISFASTPNVIMTKNDGTVITDKFSVTTTASHSSCNGNARLYITPRAWSTSSTDNTSIFLKNLANNTIKITFNAVASTPVSSETTYTNKASVATRYSGYSSTSLNSNNASVKIKSPKVVYNCTANGGSTANSTTYYNANSAIDLSKTCTKSGSSFLGWSTSSSYNGTLYTSNATVIARNTSSTIVQSMKTYTASSMASDSSKETITLYAIYTTPITVKATNQSKTYDGTALEANTSCSKSSGTLSSGHTVTCTSTGSQTIAGSTTKTLSTVKVMKGTTDVSDLYTITKTNGTLTVNKRNVTVTAKDQEKVYDGTALNATESSPYGCTASGLVSGHTVTCTSDGTITNPGSVDKVLTGETIKSGSTVVTGSYNITAVNGTLTVTGSSCPTMSGYSGTYDGNSHTITVGTTTGTIKYRTSSTGNWSNTKPTRTKAGTTTVYVGVDNNGTVTSCGNVKIVISPIHLVVRGTEQIKQYDGTPLDAENTCQVIVGSPLSGHTVSCTASGSVTYVEEGTGEKVIDDVKVMSGSSDVTENYSITKYNAGLHITPMPITLRSYDETKEYDGTPLVANNGRAFASNGCTEITGNLSGIDHYIESCWYDGTITNVGTATKEYKGVLLLNDELEYVDEANFTITAQNNTLEVTPRAVTIGTTNQSKEYDGSYLDATDDCMAVVGSLPEGSYVTCSASGSVKTVSNSPQTKVIDLSSITIFDDEDNDTTSNYTITKQDGSLEIIPKQVTLLAKNETKVYDGVELVASDSNTYDGGVCEDPIGALTDIDHTLSGCTYSSDSKITDVGTQDKVIAGATILDEDNNPADASNFEIVSNNGILEVTPNTITCTSNSALKRYDGTALTDGGGSCTGLATGDVATFTNTGTRTEVTKKLGDVNLDGTIDIKDTTRHARIVSGTEPAENWFVEVQADVDEDGDIDTDDTTIISRHVAEIQPLVNQYKVPNTISNITITRNGNDVTSNYTITQKEGELLVYPKEVTCVSNNGLKTYDGTALTAAGGTCTGLLQGHSATFTNTGSRVDVTKKLGDVNLDGTIDIKDTTRHARIVSGTEPAENWFVEVQADVDEDGDIDTDDTTIISRHVAEIQPLVNQYKVPNTIGTVTITDGTNDQSGNYIVNKQSGELLVYPKTITCTSNSGLKTYDGTALTVSGGTCTGLVNNQTATVVNNGSRVDVTKKLGDVNLDGNINISDVTRHARIVSGIEPSENWFVEMQADVDEDGDIDTDDTTIISRHVSDIEPLVNQYKVPNTIASVTIKEGTVDKTGNYVINKNAGELLVYPEEINVTTTSQSKTYDGTPLTASNDCTSNNLISGYSITCSNTGTITNFGTEPKVISTVTVKDSGNTDVTSNFIINKTNSTLEVTKRNTTCTSNSVSECKEYDGTALTLAGGTCTNLAPNQAATFVNSGSITNVSESGTRNNTIDSVTIKAGNDDVSGNYNITKVNGDLCIRQKNINVTTTNQTKVYDGTELTATNDCASTGLVSGHTITCTNTGSQTNKGTNTKTISTVTIANGGTNVTPNYNITKENGTLTITAKPITVTTTNQSKSYDGTALVATNDCASNGLLTDHNITCTNSGTITTLGSVPKVIDTVVIKKGSTTVTGNYEITKENGTLTIGESVITFKASNQTKEYDGTSLDADTTCELVGGSLPTGYTYSCTSTGSITDYGSDTKVLSTVTILDNDNNNVTGNYTVVKENGTLSISKKAITCTSSDDTKEYDGTPLTNNTGTCTNIVQGHTSIFTNTGSVINVSDSINGNNTVQSVIIKDGNRDVSGNYEITTANGTLTITKKAISVTTTNQNKAYDGGNLVAENDCSSTGLVSGHTVACVNSGTIKDVGSLEKAINTVSIKSSSLEDVTGNYEITKVNGLLEIIPKEVTCTSNSGLKTYDGTALTVAGGTCTGLIGSDEATFTNTGSRVDVTKKLGDVNLDGEINAHDLTRQARIVSGIEPADNWFVEVQADMDEDGDVDEDDKTILARHVANIEPFINQYKAPNTIESIVIYSNGADVTRNYSITEKTGELLVYPKEVSVSTSNQSKPYDGTALEATNDCSSNDLVSGHTVSCTNGGTITNVGTVTKVINTVSISDSNNDVTGNYIVNKTNGTLTITERSVSVKASNQTKEYDGTPLEGDTTCELVNSELPTGYRVECTSEGSQTIKGSSDKILNTVTIYDQNGEDVTNNYDVIKQKGTLEVTARRVTCTSGSDSKEYDGTPLTKAGGECTNLIEGHTSEFDNSGSITNVRESASNNNTIDSVIIKNNSGVDVSTNYEITKVYGDLTITPKAIEVITTNQTKEYDGEALEADNTCSSTGVPSSNLLICVNSGSITNYGTEEKVIENVMITDIAGTDVSDNYSVTKTNGTLSITKRPITIKAMDQSKVYDRLPLEADETCELISGTLIDNHTFTCVNSGSQTIVGKSTKTLEEVTIIRGRGSLTDNYEITKLNGELEVTPLEYIITLDNNEADIEEGTDKITQICDDAIYLDKDEDKKMSATENPIVIPEKTGYTFMGYFTSLDENGVEVINPEGYLTSNLDETMCEGNRTIYAKWIPKKYKLTVIYNNGEENDEFTLDYKEEKEIEDPIKKWYTFTKWEVNGEGSTMEDKIFTMGHEDAIIEAIYVKTPKECDLVLKSSKYKIDEANKIVYVAIGETLEEISKNVSSKGVIRPITEDKIVVVCEDETVEYKISRFIVPHTGNNRINYIVMIVSLVICIFGLFFVLRRRKTGK